MTEETATAAAAPAAPATDAAAPDAPATGEKTRQRRKRKWDQPAEGIVSASGAMPGLFPMAAAGAFAGLGVLPGTFPYANYFPAAASTAQSAAAQITPSAIVQQNAAAIVQKFNQDLASKGLLIQAKIQDELIAREITINDADPGVRYKLTKRQTQEEIQVKTGAVVITRGRYRPPNGPVDQEKPLYLHISAGVNLKDTAERIKAVDQAAAMVEEMLKQGQQAQAPVRSGLPGNASNGHVTPVTVNIFVGFEADPSFNLIGRIRGPNDQYINHIMTETGASVVLRGRGSGTKEGASGEELPQPLHLAISSDNPKSVEDAKTLAENLLETIRADSFSHRLPPYQVLTTVPAVSPSTYLTPQQAPHQPSLTHSAYGGYYPSVGGVYPHSYSMSQAPAPFPPSSTVALPPAEPASTPVNPYSNMLPSTLPSKVYGAVPPPKEFLGDKPAGQSDQATDSSVVTKTHVRIREKFSQSSTNDSTSSSLPATLVSAVTSMSHAGYPAVPFPFVSSPQILPPHLNGLSPAHLSANQVSQSSQIVSLGQTFLPAYSQAFASNQIQAPATSSYAGYSGVYPEAPPLQQVAQALQRPPLPVSVKPPTSSAVLATLTKAQSSSFQEKISEKQPAQRRKFQEFPVGGKDSSGEDQQGRRSTLRSGLDASILSQDPSPPGTSMPPPALRSMPPPPFKTMPHPKPISSAEPSRSTSSLSPSLSKPDDYVAPPGTGLKLVEYGEEEDESLAGHVPAPQSKPFSNGKPFWAP
ncbi:unnamed protein product [Calypogeia fissa]